MSVDSASNTLVRNSFFLAPGQPEKKKGKTSSHFPELTEDMGAGEEGWLRVESACHLNTCKPVAVHTC